MKISIELPLVEGRVGLNEQTSAVSADGSTDSPLCTLNATQGAMLLFKLRSCSWLLTLPFQTFLVGAFQGQNILNAQPPNECLDKIGRKQSAVQWRHFNASCLGCKCIKELLVMFLFFFSKKKTESKVRHYGFCLTLTWNEINEKYFSSKCSPRPLTKRMYFLKIRSPDSGINYVEREEKSAP